MDDKEVADLLRKCANSPKELLAAADKLDPKPVYNVGDYVNTGSGPLRVVSKEDYEKSKSPYVNPGAKYYFVEANGYARWSSGDDLSPWTPTEDEKKNCRDKDGNVCPVAYAVPQFDQNQKGVLYMSNIEIPRYITKKEKYMWCDGTESGFGSNCNERLATDKEILDYYTKTDNGKRQLLRVIREWVKTQ